MQTKIRSDYPDWVVNAARWVLRKLKWDYVGERPPIKKCVITAYPHSENMDLFYALMTAFALRIPIVYMMKKEWFFWPLGPVFKWLGGIPIDRSRSSNVVHQMVRWIEEHETIYVLCPPEGTRKDVQYWKMGFYWIALEAGIPVLPSFCDIEQRRSGVGEPIPITGNLEEDYGKLRDFYVGVVGRCGEIDPKYFAIAKEKSEARRVALETGPVEEPEHV